MCVPDCWNENLDIRQCITLTEIPFHIGSEQSLDLAVKWFQNCAIFHSVCCASHDRAFKPSRLLFLGNASICIHTIKDMPKKVSYLTLSHCWGKLYILRLLESNEAAFQRLVLWESLLKTFQDAIRITRRLGFSYLWIDSLCSIQDSIDDWNYEARLMGKIYKNAACNIAASDAPDSRHSCLYPRNSRTIQPEAIPSDYGGEAHLINETDIYENHILYTRAWVLQEALLARRTLDCGRGQLFWRCGEMRASEVFPGGVPTNIYNEDYSASKFKAISADNDQIILNVNILEQRLSSRKTRDQIPIAPGKGSVERYMDAPFAFWASIVSQYTEMALTKDTDTEIALAGITDVFIPFFGANFFGLWRIFMPLELLRAVSGLVERPSTLRAPSWSWLSVEGPVSYVHCTFKYGRDTLITQFVEAERLENNNMRLCLSTPLLRAKWTRPTETSRSASISEIEGQTKRMSFKGIPTLSDDFGEVYFDHFDDQMSNEDVFCICIQIRKERNDVETQGLILEEVADGVFKRLGYFKDYRELIIPFLKQAVVKNVYLI